MEDRTDRFMEVEDRYAGYQVYDPDNERIGKVDDLFVDEADQPEYIGVKMGFLGTGSTLIPWDLVRKTDDEDNRIEVSADKATVKDGPTFDDDQQITPDYEQQVHSYYGLEYTGDGHEGSYAAYDSGTESGNAGPGVAMGDTDTGAFREHDPAAEGAHEPEGDLEDEDELRVQRTEEELRAGTREREAGRVNVRKRVRTDRESIEVPTRREEVHVDRVPVEGEASEAEIGEDDIEMPVTEDEVITDKRAVKKEEIRIRKDAVEDTETVEEDVRREEVDIDNETEHRNL